MWTASEQLAQYQPAVVWLLYVCGMLVIPLHVWYPWLAEHVQRGYDGPPWFAIALVFLWLPAIVSLVAMRAGTDGWGGGVRGEGRGEGSGQGEGKRSG